MTDAGHHFLMPSSRTVTAFVSDIGYADDLVSYSITLAGLQQKADLMTAFALLFDLTISAPKLWATCVGPAPPNRSYHPWSNMDPHNAAQPHPRLPYYLGTHN